ncbi:MAG: CDP-glycerol glycerophosphotransferase family protein [Clostridiales bacterium]|nr:CDP-glycerol glycerophosphotransferase family protein [Clostridiales bacterium]
MLRAVAASRVVVIDAFCLAVSIPKKRPGQKVVQIWHAPEAIKKFSQQILDTQAGYKSRTAEILCMHRGYDYILCPADATLPFFSEAFGYPENVFVKYGLPSLDRIGLMKRPAPGEGETPERVTARSAIHARYPVLREGAGGRPLTIVYAPTFRDGDHSAGSTGNSADAAGPTGNSADAVGLVRAFVEALDKTIDSGKEMRDCRGGASPLPEMTKPEINAGAIDEKLPRIALVLKLHPLDPGYPGSGEGDSCIAPSASPAPFALKDKEFPLTDWYAAADVIITDYSGVAVEAAAAGVASYYYVYDIDDYKARRGLNVDLREEAVGKYAFMDAGALARQVLRDFSNGGYDYDALAAFRGKYLETPLSGNARALAAFIAGLA